MRSKNRRVVVVFDLDEPQAPEVVVAQIAARLTGRAMGDMAKPADLAITRLRKITFAGETYVIGE